MLVRSSVPAQCLPLCHLLQAQTCQPRQVSSLQSISLWIILQRASSIGRLEILETTALAAATVEARLNCKATVLSLTPASSSGWTWVQIKKLNSISKVNLRTLNGQNSLTVPFKLQQQLSKIKPCMLTSKKKASLLLMGWALGMPINIDSICYRLQISMVRTFINLLPHLNMFSLWKLRTYVDRVGKRQRWTQRSCRFWKFEKECEIRKASSEFNRNIVPLTIFCSCT